MKTRQKFGESWLPGYTGCRLESFGKFILLLNFVQYPDHFCNVINTSAIAESKPLPSATAEGITIINFGMGTENASNVKVLQ
jgi:AMP nucleosidase